jgi:penicillin-binding protein 1A
VTSSKLESVQSLLNQEETETTEEPVKPRSPLWAAMRRFPFHDPEFRDRKIAARASFLALMVACAVFGGMIGLVLVYSINLPQMAELERYRPDTTTELFDIHGKVFGSFALERRIVVPYSEFPPVLRNAILSIEDKDFESNGGINLVRMVEAAYEDVHSKGKTQGASTLTMQLARNLFLSSEKTYGRKIQEIFLTLQIERHFTKQQIFTLYANQIYLGRGTYGFEAGSEYYFSKPAKELTLPEAALLAALPKGPEYYSPVRFPDRALRRRNLVLTEMANDHKITEDEAETAKAAPLGLKLEPPANSEAPYFVEEVRKQLERDYGAEEAHGAGLRVYTTLDLDLQRVANKAVLDETAAYERRHGWKARLPNVLRQGTPLDQYKHPDWTQPFVEGAYFHALVTEVTPAKIVVRIGTQTATMTEADWKWTAKTKGNELAQVGDIVYVRVTSVGASTGPAVALEQDSGAQASMMAMDNSNGEVLAMVGGRDFALSQFNRATQAQRQVGSSFKPYVYTAALESGMSPTDTVLDTPTTFQTPGGPYTPHDYERGNFSGTMTLINAFAMSRNIPALRLADKVGINNVIAVAHRFGITSNLPAFLPVAIGAADITLAEQVGAYSSFPNDGIRIEPHYIRKVVEPNGQQLPTQTPEVHESTSLDIARQMMILLQAVVQHGTAAKVASMKHAFGGKTGTTNDFTDAWFVGFSPSVTAGAWVGFDNRESLGSGETGAKAALPIWMDFMKVAVADKPNEEFSKPNAPKKQLDIPQPALGSEPAAAKPATDDDDDTEKPVEPALPSGPPSTTTVIDPNDDRAAYVPKVKAVTIAPIAAPPPEAVKPAPPAKAAPKAAAPPQ